MIFANLEIFKRYLIRKKKLKKKHWTDESVRLSYFRLFLVDDSVWNCFQKKISSNWNSGSPDDDHNKIDEDDSKKRII